MIKSLYNRIPYLNKMVIKNFSSSCTLSKFLTNESANYVISATTQEITILFKEDHQPMTIGGININISASTADVIDIGVCLKTDDKNVTSTISRVIMS